MSNAWHYLEGAWESVKPTMVISWVIISYVLFPTEAYVTAAIGVAGVMVLDILTKYYALARVNGGDEKIFIKRLWIAIVTGHIRSSALWDGTVRKMISYLVIMILAGLSIRVAPLKEIAIFFATIAYSVMFWRETQSIAENMVEAGHSDFLWVLNWSKRQHDNAIKKATELDIEINKFK